MKKEREKLWNTLSLETKILLAVTLMILTLFASNVFIYLQTNKIAVRMDTAYASNVDLSKLSEALTNVQEDLRDYVSTKSSDSLESYYRSEQSYRSFLERLNDKPIDQPVKLLEKNVRAMSDTYLKFAEEAVQAKRGRNVERYKATYERTQALYKYINRRISELNDQQFRSNTSSYQTLRNALRYMEIFSLVILIIVMTVGILLLRFIIKDMVTPLTGLARTAELVGQGNFHVKMPESHSEDEIGIVTRTFNQMVGSLDAYVEQVRESVEKEQAHLERELLMENHLKEARLKYLQSQINPHFLFNSLNAGAQLAMMENAEKTCIFLDKMADFFRYNVKKGLEDATIEDEIEAVENYIYIQNVRFAGEIQYEEDIDWAVTGQKMPSMILQPIVENAVRHGIREIGRQGKILLKVQAVEDGVRITVKDNGKGIEKERLAEIMEKKTAAVGDSTGIGLDNVMSRLELYFQKKVITIRSDGDNQGTEVILDLPSRREES